MLLCAIGTDHPLLNFESLLNSELFIIKLQFNLKVVPSIMLHNLAAVRNLNILLPVIVI